MTKSDFPALRMTVEGGRLIPAGPFDQERLNSYRRGTVVFVRFTEEKDRVLVRKWFAIIGLVLKQCSTPWKTRDEAHEAIKLALGIVNLSKTVGGDFMAYPKSLTELDNPELTEALESMIELLSKMTGVDVETLRKETAHVDEHIDHDPETGEITEPENTKSGFIPEEPVPADDQPLPVSAAPDDVPPTPSPGAPTSEREVLIRYARDVLPMAADTTVPLSTLKEIEKQWGIDEISKLSEDGKAKAHAISKSMRSISNNPKLLAGVLNHYAEVLECTVEEFGGANG